MVLIPLSLSASTMRWKPSVSSWSPPAAFASMLCTVVADISLPQNLLSGTESKSVQCYKALDVVSQPQCMLAHQTFGTLGRARFQCAHDFLVINDRSPGAILLENRALPNGTHMKEQRIGYAADQRVLAQTDDRLVKLDVGVGIFAHLGGDLVLGKLVDQGVQPTGLFGSGFFGCKPGGHAFECRPNRDHVENLGFGFAHD